MNPSLRLRFVSTVTGIGTALARVLIAPAYRVRTTATVRGIHSQLAQNRLLMQLIARTFTVVITVMPTATPL
jgi:uncharacterized membrane protein